MADQWFYARGKNKLGPVSGHQLKELAAAGAILPTDTVWQEGNDRGVQASRIKNLFAPIEADPASESKPETLIANAEPAPETAKPAAIPKAPPRVEKKGTATASKGADIVSQDGMYARYRMKCTECGTNDSSCRTIRILNKTLTTNFYCPKCKKKRVVVIQCRSG